MNLTSSGTAELYTTTEPHLVLQWNLSHWNSYIFQMNLLPSFIYIWILLIVGVLGNSLVCYIYHFKESVRNKNLSSNIFILALSWFDLVNVMMSLPFELFIILNFVQFDHPILCKVIRFISFFCNNSTSIILLAIAIDRLRGFLSGPRLLRLKPSTSKAIVLIAMVISAAISWPMLVFFGTWTFQFPNGVYGQTCLITNKYLNSTLMTVFTVTLLGLHLCFDISFTIIYSIIGKRICYESDVTRRMSENSTRINSATRESRKASDISHDDDVFVTSQDNSNITSIKWTANIQPTDSSGKTNLIHSTSNNAKSICSGEKGSEHSLYVSLLKRTETFRTSVKINFKHKRSSRYSSHTSDWRTFNRRRPASRTSIMLFLVTIAYMVTFLPYCILVVFRTADPGMYYKLSNSGKSLYQLFLRSYCLGSAINPIIYSFVNPRFRKKCRMALQDIFCCHGCRKSD